jgi:hypothetical protein
MVCDTGIDPLEKIEHGSLQKSLIRFLLLLICFFLPIQIYLIGGSLGAGLQGAFFRYQVTSFGTGFIFLSQDMGYILSGIYTGKTALSVLVWLIGDLLLLAGTSLSLMIHGDRLKKIRITAGLLIISSGIFFLLSCMLQYSIVLHTAAGISLPVTVPLIISLGWLLRNNY